MYDLGKFNNIKAFHYDVIFYFTNLKKNCLTNNNNINNFEQINFKKIGNK